MYQILMVCHSYMRWLVVASLLFAIYRACKGYFVNSEFTGTDNAVRHWTATIAHIQLMIGMILYFQSPVVKYFLANFKTTIEAFDPKFFGWMHSSLMLVSIILITIGSALSKRKQTDRDKFKTMLIWFSISLIIIFTAIPWPFSPFANRPYFR